MKRALSIALAALAAAPAATASAAGGPVGAMQGTPVGVPGLPDRYLTVGLRSETLVQHMRHGDVVLWRRFAGDFGVPAAAYDGSTTGLSADGRILVLSSMPKPFPQKRTDLLVLDAPALRVNERIRLRGWFTVDAVSPYGDRLYLIHYRHGNVLRYEVRAYDLERHRLLSKPIVDPREPDEKMLGTPFARTMSADGRWAYTLYARPKDAPFIHALDTQRGTAACIDLDDLASADVSTLHLVVPPKGGGPLRVVDQGGAARALVDRRTFKVSEPPPQHNPAVRRGTASTDKGDPPWIAPAGALAALLLLALIAVARRRRYERSASLRNAS